MYDNEPDSLGASGYIGDPNSNSRKFGPPALLKVIYIKLVIIQALQSPSIDQGQIIIWHNKRSFRQIEYCRHFLIVIFPVISLCKAKSRNPPYEAFN